MKEAGVVALVGSSKNFQQARVGQCAVGDAAEFSVILRAAVLADAKENEAVDGFLGNFVYLFERC